MVIEEFPEIKLAWEDLKFQKKIGNIIGVKISEQDELKRNKSSYLIFCCTVRPNIVNKNPTMKPNEIMVCLGKLWSCISCEDKLKYEKLALEDKQRYQALKDANKKNKPTKISAYIKFCTDERTKLKAQYPCLSTKDITAKLGSLWNELKEKNPGYLKEKYNYEEHKKFSNTIPDSINSTNVKAIQDLISYKS
ncbi:hypothetical protein AGMMS49579_00910 [Spirochaetia bacterium]|nr:hypothetical protein AGMMS49579_00910 [Spirochaetia bacterium]